MKDVQSEHDHRDITIDRVGVKNLNYPVTVVQDDNNFYETAANISMSVKLDKEFRGTHMSRFIEALEKYHDNISRDGLEKISLCLCEKLGASESSIKFEFPYYFKKISPVSKIESYSHCDVFMSGNICGEFDFILGIKLNVQTLCPCSKEISDYGAHNQRASINLNVRFFNEPVKIDELIKIIEDSSSSPLHTLLKREDEKYVTEHAYNNPKFVEDVLRDLAASLNNDARISWYKIIVQSYESIHDHNAFCEIERLKEF